MPDSASGKDIPGPSPRTGRPAISIVARFDKPQPGMMKIGEAAARVRTSVQTIRLYEAEGLLISFKSAKGTRWYSEEDVLWIRRIQDLVADGLNFAGIRRLLAQLPCWSLKPCPPEDHAACSMRYQVRSPCWIAPDRLCVERLKECYQCTTYRSARHLVDLKVHLTLEPKLSEGHEDENSQEPP